MLMAERMVQGVDVWINTPRRPWEACGTSGMKVLVNGGINLSVLDGWWAEAYAPEVGWALGDLQEHGDDPAWDAADAEALYERLEQQVVPEFYTRNECGIPTAWVARMRESMARLTPQYSTHRAVREYTERHYLPAAAAYRARSSDKGSAAEKLVALHTGLAARWAGIRFGAATWHGEGDRRSISVEVFLGAMDPNSVRVELYTDGLDHRGAGCEEMKRGLQIPGEGGGHTYDAAISSDRPASDYTARILPSCDGLAVPLEAPWILWQK